MSFDTANRIYLNNITDTIMRRTHRNIIISALLVAIVLVAGALYMYLPAGKTPEPKPSSEKSPRKAPQKKHKANTKQNKNKRQKPRVNPAVLTNRLSNARSQSLEDDEEKNLSAEMKNLLSEIQSCLDNNDRKALTKVCDKIAKIRRERGEEAVPAIVRERAVEAIGHFLPASLAELLAFMADSNAEIAQAAADKFEDEVLNDTSIGDRELSDILVSMAKVINNEDTIDSMMMSIDGNMRNSVKVSTCNQLLESATDAVVKQLRETIADILEVEVEELPADNKTLQDKLNEWLKENPDDEDDEDFYKGSDE